MPFASLFGKTKIIYMANVYPKEGIECLQKNLRAEGSHNLFSMSMECTALRFLEVELELIPE